MDLSSLAAVLAAPNPCTKCPRWADCRDMLLACREFEIYVRTGMWPHVQVHTPTGRRYDRIFGGDDDE